MSHTSASFSTSETITCSSAKGKHISTRYMQRARLRGAIWNSFSSIKWFAQFDAFNSRLWICCKQPRHLTCKICSELVSSQRRRNSCCSSVSRLPWQLVRKVGDRYRNSMYPCLFHSLSAITVNILGFAIPSSETEPFNCLFTAESLVLVGLHRQSTKTEFQRAQRYFIYSYNLSVTVTVKIKARLQHFHPSLPRNFILEDNTNFSKQ